jgi:hypothetical protein
MMETNIETPTFCGCVITTDRSIPTFFFEHLSTVYIYYVFSISFTCGQPLFLLYHSYSRISTVHEAMAQRKWDAYRCLNLAGRSDHGMTCVGTTRYGKRCRWDIPDEDFSRICAILDGFETEAPKKATPYLQTLARLSLCQDYHRNQAHEKTLEWQVAITDATKFYDSGRDLRTKIRDLEAVLHDETTMRANLEGELTTKIALLSKEESAKSVLVTDNASLRRQLEQAMDHANQLRNAASESANSYEMCLSGKNQQISNLQAEIDDRDVQIRDHLRKENEIYLPLREDIKTVEDNNERLQDQVIGLTGQLKDQSQASNQISSELAQAKQVREQAVSQQIQLSSQMEVASQTNAELKSQLLGVQSILEESSEATSRMQSQLDANVEKMNQLGLVISELEEKSTCLAHQLSHEQITTKELQQLLEVKTNSWNNTMSQLHLLEQDYRKSQDLLKSTEAELLEARKMQGDDRKKLEVFEAAGWPHVDEHTQESTGGRMHIADSFEGWLRTFVGCCGRGKPQRRTDVPPES